MRYCANITLNPGVAGIADTYVFSANNLRDPDFTSTGHQPLGFDQFVPTLYDHYTVIGSKITVSFQSNTGTTSNTYFGGVRLSDDTTTIADPQSIIERSRCKWQPIGLAESAVSKKIIMKCSPPKFLASAKGALSNAQLRGSSSVNPTEQAYWHVFLVPSLSGTDNAAIPLMVLIEYIAVLTEPNSDLAQS